MQNGIAIIVAGTIIALAILFTFRWEISTTSNPAGDVRVYLLHRWTGTVTKCDDQWEQVRPVPGGAIKLGCTAP
jgi:hypothetical protein